MAVIAEKIRASSVKMHIAVEYDHNGNHVFAHADVDGFPRIVTNNGNNAYKGHKSLEIPVTEFVMWSSKYHIDHRSKRDMETHRILKPRFTQDKIWIDINNSDHVTNLTYNIAFTELDGTNVLHETGYCPRHQTFERRVNHLMREVNKYILELLQE